MMAVPERGCAVTFVLLWALPGLFSQTCDNFHILIVAGFEGVTVKVKNTNNPDITFIEFDGNINRPIRKDEIGDVTIKEHEYFIDSWIGMSHWLIEAKPGDLIYFNLRIGIKGTAGCNFTGFSSEIKGRFAYDSWLDLSNSEPAVTYTISSYILTSTPSSRCRQTATEVHSRKLGAQSICSNEIIFQDNFDTLRKDRWTIEQYIPLKPEYPFVSYQPRAVSVDNSILRIQPMLLDSLPGFDRPAVLGGKLDLSEGCTRSGSCAYQSRGPQILQSVVSGRITSNSVFTFKYGIIEVRAKLPQGDWLYPDILLQSISKSYGTEDNKMLRIAGARGNAILKEGTEEYGNTVLYGGPITDIKYRTNPLAKMISATEWGNDFHVYSMTWTPEMITLSVDGEEWGRINEPLHIAPFNASLGITLGLSAGGIIEFPDKSVSGLTTDKPWKNRESRGRLKFYNDKSTWLRTWVQPALLVDYVTVRAL